MRMAGDIKALLANTHDIGREGRCTLGWCK